MINARGTNPFKALVLSARDAARRFAPSRLLENPRRNTWRPIVLRWRRWFKRSTNAPVSRATYPAKLLRFPQTHFHFVIYLSDRAKRDRKAAFPSTLGVQRSLVLLEHKSTIARATTQFHYPDRKHRPLLATTTRSPSWPKFHAAAPAVAGVLRQSIPQPIAAYPLRRSSPLLFRSNAESVSPIKRSDECSPTVFTRSRIQRTRLHMYSSLAPVLRANLPPPLHERKRLQIGFDSPEYLVWRRRALSPSALAEDESHPQRPESRGGRAIGSIPSQETAPLPSPGVQRTTAQKLTQIDPGLLDRLTDDVIRRVEQRIRIDRQRRGL
jgi:hypothetical protein